jgi:hypothetical protein
VTESHYLEQSAWIGENTDSRRAAAQQLRAIGFLSSRSQGDSAPLVAAFREGLKEGGYGEGVNAAIEYGWAESRYDQLPDLAADLAIRSRSGWLPVSVNRAGMLPG